MTPTGRGRLWDEVSRQVGAGSGTNEVGAYLTVAGRPERFLLEDDDRGMTRVWHRDGIFYGGVSWNVERAASCGAARSRWVLVQGWSSISSGPSGGSG